MKRVLVVIVISISIACNSKNYIPRDIIKPAQMREIFWDMIRSDILVQEIIKKDSTQNIKGAGFAIIEKIFAIHNTDRAKFKKSLAFYEKNPALMRTIFDSLNAIQLRRNSLELEKKYRPVKDTHLLHNNKIP